MANTKIKNLQSAVSQQINSGSWYVYVADISSNREAKFKASDLSTTVSNSGDGAGLIESTSGNKIKLKSLKSNSPLLEFNSSPGTILASFYPASLDLSACNNTNSKFLKSIDLANDSGNSVLSIENGGTGALNQQSAINALTMAGVGTANQVLKTDGLNATYESLSNLITAGAGLSWDLTTSPNTLNVDLNDVTFTSSVIFNNEVSLNGHNLDLGTGWLSGDGSDEGINIDTSGRVFIGHSGPAATYDTTNTAALTVGDNISFTSGNTREINVMSPSTGAGNEFKITGSAGTATNTAGGAITLSGGAANGTGAGGAINLLAGNSGTGNGDINLSITDGGTIAQVMKIHGSNKHFTFGSTGANNNAVVDIQNDTTGAACLELDQNDNDEPFIIFTGTSATDSSTCVSSLHGTFPNHTNANDGWVRININGTDKWVPFFATPA